MEKINGYKIENVERALKAIVERTRNLHKLLNKYNDEHNEKMADAVSSCIIEYDYIQQILEGDIEE